MGIVTTPRIGSESQATDWITMNNNWNGYTRRCCGAGTYYFNLWNVYHDYGGIIPLGSGRWVRFRADTLIKTMDFNGVSQNRIVGADFTGMTSYFYVDLRNQNMDANALNVLYTSLYSGASYGNNAKQLLVSGNPGYDASNKNIATNKGWSVS
jgi:hypothetical protein